MKTTEKPYYSMGLLMTLSWFYFRFLIIISFAWYIIPVVNNMKTLIHIGIGYHVMLGIILLGFFIYYNKKIAKTDREQEKREYKLLMLRKIQIAFVLTFINAVISTVYIV